MRLYFRKFAFPLALSLLSCSGKPDLALETPPANSRETFSAKEERPAAAEKNPVTATTPAKAFAAEDSTVSEVSFFAIGDVLFHAALFKQCEEDSSLCRFEYVFEPWEKDIRAADIAVVNQETIFVPRKDGYTSYPNFGTPEEVGLAEISAGFDIVTHATNHTIDRRAKAVDYTVDFWSGKPAKALGIHPTREDAEEPFTLEKNGIRFAFVNFTYGLNGQKLPEDRPYLVDVIDSSGEWLSTIRKAESAAEVTVAFLHIGTEYKSLPTQEAVETVERAIDAGADVLVCAHPHVIEPYGIFTTKAGNKALVYWSLGNFVSNQQDLPTNLGGVAKFTVRKVEKGGGVKLEITSATFEGSVTQQEVGKYRAVPLAAYSDSLAVRHRLRQKLPDFTLSNLQGLFEKTVGEANLCGTELPDGILPLSISKISDSAPPNGQSSP